MCSTIDKCIDWLTTKVTTLIAGPFTDAHNFSDSCTCLSLAIFLSPNILTMYTHNKKKKWSTLGFSVHSNKVRYKKERKWSEYRHNSSLCNGIIWVSVAVKACCLLLFNALLSIVLKLKILFCGKWFEPRGTYKNNNYQHYQ